MQYMFHAGTDMVVVRGKENLCLVFKPAVGLAVEDSGIVAFKFVADVVTAAVDRAFPGDGPVPFVAQGVTAYIYKTVFHADSIAYFQASMATIFPTFIFSA